MCLTWLTLGRSAWGMSPQGIVCSDELETHITDIIWYMYICSFISSHNITHFYFQLRQDVQVFRVKETTQHLGGDWLTPN